MQSEEHQREVDGELERTSSENRIRANRENATRSTGPRTAEGKRQSSRNALKHGAFASTSSAIRGGVLAEDAALVDEYVADIVNALEPRDALEYRLAERVANLFLRVDRTVRFEASMIAEDGGALACLGSSGDEARQRASARALRSTMDLVAKIDARNCSALHKSLRLYRELRDRDSEFDADDN